MPVLVRRRHRRRSPCLSDALWLRPFQPQVLQTTPPLQTTPFSGAFTPYHKYSGLDAQPAECGLYKPDATERISTMSVGNASARPASAQRGLLARHPLISFFVMAYAFSWIAWSPWVLSEEGVGLLPFELSGATAGLLNAAAILLLISCVLL